MNNSFARYKFNNDVRLFMNNKVWDRLGRHGFSKLSQTMTCRKRYGKRLIEGDLETNNHIAQLLEGDKPCMIARFGFTEMNFLYSYLEFQNKETPKTKAQIDDAMERLCLLSGFFPKDISLGERFAGLYFESIPEMDLCGVWNLYMEDYVLDTYAPECALAELKYLEPWNTASKVAWSSKLAGKKVLVIHPFAETIEKQYPKHREIFSNKFEYQNILPDFELVTIKAVQSLGGENDEYSNWFDALDSMIEQAKQIDFDVAIIGCGAYGLPLAAAIKKMGKKAIHLGGATQLMFGIWGHRWDQIPEAKTLYNEYWIRPSEHERPKRADEVEDGCYW